MDGEGPGALAGHCMAVVDQAGAQAANDEEGTRVVLVYGGRQSDGSYSGDAWLMRVRMG